jgi:hypothetical protein
MEAHEHPERSKELGVLFITDTTWAGNSKTIAKNCGMKKDTFTHSLLNHGFKTDTAVPFCKEVAALGNAQCVRLYSHPLLSRTTLARDIEALRQFRSSAKDRASVGEVLFPPLNGAELRVDGGEVRVTKSEEDEECEGQWESVYDLGDAIMAPTRFDSVMPRMMAIDSWGCRSSKGEWGLQHGHTDSNDARGLILH